MSLDTDFKLTALLKKGKSFRSSSESGLSACWADVGSDLSVSRGVVGSKRGSETGSAARHKRSKSLGVKANFCSVV